MRHCGHCQQEEPARGAWNLISSLPHNCFGHQKKSFGVQKSALLLFRNPGGVLNRKAVWMVSAGSEANHAKGSLVSDTNLPLQHQGHTPGLVFSRMAAPSKRARIAPAFSTMQWEGAVSVCSYSSATRNQLPENCSSISSRVGEFSVQHKMQTPALARENHPRREKSLWDLLQGSGKRHGRHDPSWVRV